jgi:asparagine synthase (glutamine-hydrolysing)
MKRALDVLRHRGPDGCRLVVLPGGVAGCCVLKVTGECLQPLVNGEVFVYNGEIYNYQRLMQDYDVRVSSDTEVVFEVLKRGETLGVLRRLDGDFALAVIGEELLLARDAVGVKPLYYGFYGDALCFASEIKALDVIGVRRVSSVAPGKMLCYNGEIREERYYTPSFKSNTLSEEENIDLLSQLLVRSVEKRRYVRSAVAFSGGLDSSLIAHLLREGDVELFAVSMEGSHDARAVERAAVLLGLKSRLHHYRLTEREVERVLPEVVAAVESSNLFTVSIAFPLYIAAREAQERGFRVMLSGQGADELFAGYKRYESMESEVLRRALREDFCRIAEVNLERDDKAAMAHSVELRVPFLDRDVVSFALSVPVELKVKKGVRKYALRRAAQRLRLAEELVWAEKRAAQYSSGVYRALRRVARGSFQR